MKKYPLLVLFGTCYIITLGQTSFKPSELYFRLTSKASSLYEQESFKKSGLTFDSAFATTNGIGTVPDEYDASCSWAMAGNIGKAFTHLNHAVISGKWSNLSYILSDSNLSSIHSDKRWLPMIAAVKKNKEEKEKNLNKPLVALLDTIYHDDQDDRHRIDSIEKKFGWKSPEMKNFWTIINYKDSTNLLKIKHLIDSYGWLGPDEVGNEGSSTIFLVIQHADSLTQVTYLPMMREAVRKGNAQSRNLALLEDRVLMKQGKEQIYGSQVIIDSTGKKAFYPIRDEPNVNKRRASVKLGPLEDYAKKFGIDYKVPALKNKHQ